MLSAPRPSLQSKFIVFQINEQGGNIRQRLFNTVFPNGLDGGASTVGGSSNQYGLFGMLLWNQDGSKPFKPEGPLEEFIVSGAAFGTSPFILYWINYFSYSCWFLGFGLFNLVLSLLPKGIR